MPRFHTALHPPDWKGREERSKELEGKETRSGGPVGDRKVPPVPHPYPDVLCPSQVCHRSENCCKQPQQTPPLKTGSQNSKEKILNSRLGEKEGSKAGRQAGWLFYPDLEWKRNVQSTGY